MYNNNKNNININNINNNNNNQCTSSFQRSYNWVWLGASKSTQRYKVRERKWQTRETLARGVYGGYTPLHTNGKKGTKRNIEGLHTLVRLHLIQSGFSHVFGVYSEPIENVWQ